MNMLAGSNLVLTKTESKPPLTESEFMTELRDLVSRLAPDKANLLTADLDDDSMLLEFNVCLSTNNGRQIRVRGQSVLNNILAASALPEAPDILQSIHYSNIWRPLRVKMIDFLQEQTDNQRRLPMLEGSLSDYDANINPAIPTDRQFPGAGPASLSEEPQEP